MKKNGIILNDFRRSLSLNRPYPNSILYFHTFLVFNIVKTGRSLSQLKNVNINIQSYLSMEDNRQMCNEPNSISELIRRSTQMRWQYPKIPTSDGVRILQVYKLIIIIELMYIVLVPFDWTRALSPFCFLFVHNSMNFCVFDLFITRWTFFCLTNINNMATDDGSYDSVRVKAIFTIIHTIN
jgi:hypothetical protein